MPSWTCSASRRSRRVSSSTRCGRPARCCALRHDLGPRPRRARARDRGRAAHGLRRLRHGKAAIEALLQRETVAGAYRASCCTRATSPGPWPSITPAGNLDLDVWRAWPWASRSRSRTRGSACSTMCTRDDVARRSTRACRPAAIGSSFHVVSAQAMTLRGLAAGVAGWFGREAMIDFVDSRGVRAARRQRACRHDARARRPQHRRGIDRAREILGYQPRYSSLEAMQDSLRWLVAEGHVDLGGQAF